MFGYILLQTLTFLCESKTACHVPITANQAYSRKNKVVVIVFWKLDETVKAHRDIKQKAWHGVNLYICVFAVLFHYKSGCSDFAHVF